MTAAWSFLFVASSIPRRNQNSVFLEFLEVFNILKRILFFASTKFWALRREPGNWNQFETKLESFACFYDETDIAT